MNKLIKRILTNAVIFALSTSVCSIAMAMVKGGI
jgi:hypothetical protein